MQKNFEKKNLLVSCQPLTKNAGSRSVRQWYGSADPDPYQNVTNPKHCLLASQKFVLYLRVGCAGILQGRVSLSAGLLQDGHGAKSEDHPACGESLFNSTLSRQVSWADNSVRYVP
jgi:hypothetical protein